MIKNSILFFALLLAVFTIDSFAQNPFQTPSPQQEKEQSKTDMPSNLMPQWLKDKAQKAMVRIITLQSEIRQKAGVYAREIRENPWGKAFWSYLGLAFAYGVIHALGPGHGKVFVSTYFLSRKANIRHGVLMGGLMSFMHVLSAVVLVFLFYFVLKAGGLGSVDEAGRHLQRISAGLITLVGLFLAWKSLKAIIHKQNDECGCCTSPSDRKGILSLCLAVGLVPCPGAALILFFSITLDILPVGLMAMLFLSSGLALTTIGFALTSLFARNILAKMATSTNINPRLYHIPALTGAIFISLLGAVLFFNPVF
ncbi:MAG: nickel/cobalt transporter [Desulfonatronovibrio sp.]